MTPAALPVRRFPFIVKRTTGAQVEPRFRGAGFLYSATMRHSEIQSFGVSELEKTSAYECHAPPVGREIDALCGQARFHKNAGAAGKRREIDWQFVCHSKARGDAPPL